MTGPHGGAEPRPDPVLRLLEGKARRAHLAELIRSGQTNVKEDHDARPLPE